MPFTRTYDYFKQTYGISFDTFKLMLKTLSRYQDSFDYLKDK